MIYEITEMQRDRWHAEGYLKLTGLLSPEEIGNVRSWVDEIAAWPNDSERWVHHREQTERGDVRLARTENFVPYHAGMKELLTTGRLLAVLEALLNEPTVLYKEKINYKYPGGGGYAAHQDAPAYEFIRHHVTCLLPVDPMHEDNGCLHFSPGRHREGLIAKDDRGCISPEVAEKLTWIPVEMEPGDALFFSSYAPHKSPLNSSDRARRGLYVTYNALSEGDLREQYYENRKKHLAHLESRGAAEPGKISTIGHFRGKAVTE